MRWSDNSQSDEIAAHHQPKIECTSQKEWFGTSLLKFFDACIGAQCSHCHGEHKGVNVFDGTIQWNVFYCGSLTPGLQQCVDANDNDKVKGKLGDGNLVFLFCGSAFAALHT